MIEQVCPMPNAGSQSSGVFPPLRNQTPRVSPSDPTVRNVARKIRVNQFIGVGSLLQLCGLAFLFAMFWFVGTETGVAFGIIIATVLLIIGHVKSKAWHCSACGTKLLNHGVTICPGCRQEF